MMFLTIYGLNWMKVVEADMTRNCSRDDLDLTAGNMCSVIELLTVDDTEGLTKIPTRIGKRSFSLL